MANPQRPSDDDESRHQSSSSSFDPFIKFRRFADEQAKSFLGLFSDMSDEMGKRARRQQEELQARMSREETNENSSGESPWSQGASLLDSAMRAVERDAERAWSEWEQKVEDARRQADEWMKQYEEEVNQRDHGKSSCQEDDESQINVRTDTNSDGRSHTWQWFQRPGNDSATTDDFNSWAERIFAELYRLNSPDHAPLATPAFIGLSAYSPLRLERDLDPHFPWRDAFEDLLIAEQGRPLETRKVLDARRGESLSEWLVGLSKRTRHPELEYYCHGRQPLRGLWDISGRHSLDSWKHDAEDGHDDSPDEVYEEDEEEEAGFTEEDLYRQYFGIAGKPVENPASSLEMAKPPVNPATTDKPSVLSTLTTTERTVLPDGTITTKVVLKKRFSDGKEESSETIQTTLPSSEQKETHDQQNSDSQITDLKAKQSKGGWFWSS